jgi:hypothetical protein
MLPSRQIILTPTEVARLFSSVQFVPYSCWGWTGYITPHGYSQVVFRGLKYYAHRLIYEALRGPIDPNLVIDHLCRHRACVNPWHMEVVTDSENIRRGIPHNRLKTGCYRGHPYTPENVYIEKKTGGRRCRICARLKYKAYYDRQCGRANNDQYATAGIQGGEVRYRRTLSS